MQVHAAFALHIMDVAGPILIGLAYIFACSFFKEPGRRNINAIMIAGAGAAYLNGGLGIWEFTFTALVTFCAYKGLHSYSFIGVGWLLHTGWDALFAKLYHPHQTASLHACEIDNDRTPDQRLPSTPKCRPIRSYKNELFRQ
ncbi:MAG TPA: DUF6010 family protein [Pyrinomonadaceae bacterium]|nr:DUF6010 family protein [Pyrinomonadaceae bacterium]